jgi:hypothetical protein
MPRYSDDINLFKVDRATDAQLELLDRLRRANGVPNRSDFNDLSKGEAGRFIRLESAISRQQRKYKKEDERKHGKK